MSLSDERKLVQNNSKANEAQACRTEVSFILLWTEGVPRKKASALKLIPSSLTGICSLRYLAVMTKVCLEE